MKQLTINTLSGAVLAIAMMFAAIIGQPAFAQAPAPAPVTATATAKDPQVVVEKVAAELFALVKTKNAAKTSDEVYFQQVEKVLDGVVSFPFIANSVMGKAVYTKATQQQRDAFLKVFKSGLVKSYAKGITGYADSAVKLVGVDKQSPTRVTVKQEVSDKDVVHKLDYTMVQDKSGNWKLINVVLNGVNLGKSFSGQYKAALKKYNGDIDKVTQNWLTEA